MTWQRDGQAVTLRLTHDMQRKVNRRPDSLAYDLKIRAAEPVEFTVRLRLPWWLSGATRLSINGEPVAVNAGPSQYIEIHRVE